MIVCGADAAILGFYARDYITSREAEVVPVTDADLATYSIIMVGLSVFLRQLGLYGLVPTDVH